MTPEQITYKILYKVINHHEKQPTVKLIFIESGELKLSDITFRLFLKSMETTGYIKIWAENKDDWGQIIVTPLGTQFVNEFKESIHSERDYENFSTYLDSLVKKNTLELIRAEKSAELHLEQQKRSYEVQRALASSGKANSLAFCAKQVDFAEAELYKIREELEVRKILAMETANKIGGNNTVQHQPPPAIAQTKIENIEDEWANEAEKLGVKKGTLPYLQFLSKKKEEEKHKDDEKKRIKDFAYYVGENNIYCPTLEKFKQQLAIQKMNPDNYKYATWLWDEQVRYSTAKRYYDTWGARGTGIDRHDLYGEIISLLNTEIETGIKGFTPDNAIHVLTESIQKITETTLPIETKSVEPLTLNDLKNNFDNVEISEVYNHFYNAFVKSRHFTERELLEYVYCAFDKMKVPDTLFILKNTPTKHKVMKVFYSYYKDVAGKPYGKQKRYAALLGEYFNGYTTEAVSTNFNK